MSRKKFKLYALFCRKLDILAFLDDKHLGSAILAQEFLLSLFDYIILRFSAFLSVYNPALFGKIQFYL